MSRLHVVTFTAYLVLGATDALAEVSLHNGPGDSTHLSSGQVTPAASISLIPWSDWYPMDRGQIPGQRALNYWSFGGQSTWRMPSPPSSLPITFHGRLVSYYGNWTCSDFPPIFFPPTATNCPAAGQWYEVLSQGTGSGDGTLLEHWTRGSSTQNASHWETYYDRSAFPTCRANSITGNLDRKELRVPLILGVPQTPGTEWVGPSVCTVVTDSTAPGPLHLDARMTSLWFLVGKNVGRFIDSTGTDTIVAVNEYYTDNAVLSADMDRYCAMKNDPDACVSGQGRRRLSSDGVSGSLYNYEKYVMRRVAPGNRLTNGLFAWTGPHLDGKWVSDTIEFGTTIQRWHLTSFTGP